MLAFKTIRPTYQSGDPDAVKFLYGATITDTTIRNATHILVTRLKENSLWSKFSAIYPFVGGTATAHKFNLKNPLDSDIAFRLTFNGTNSGHSSTGYLPNGTNDYADTHFNPSNDLSSQDSCHLSYYSRTNNAAGNYVEIGCLEDLATDRGFFVATLNSTGVNGANNNMCFSSRVITDTITTSNYFIIGSRISSSQQLLFKNGVLMDTQSATSSGKPNLSVYIGNWNAPGFVNSFSNRECAFATIGTGLTEAECSTLNTIVQEFQTTLGRNV